jgi:uncharacterized integral membrane protein (TIGR00698 family)
VLLPTKHINSHWLGLNYNRLCAYRKCFPMFFIIRHFTDMPTRDRYVVVAMIILACLSTFSWWASPPLALCSGMLLALLRGNPIIRATKSLSKFLQQWCIIGLGFGLNIGVMIAVSTAGIGITISLIAGTIALGIFFARLLRMSARFGYLIAVGTAICGASAMTALAPIIRADDDEFSIGLAVVFFLNGVALILFPLFGTFLAMDQHQFGMWSALAIHDTSSVIGAAQRYGVESVKIAVTMKLARALWIIPLSLCTAFVLSWYARRASADATPAEYRIEIPWFIVGFVLASFLRTMLPVWGVLPEEQMALFARWATTGSKYGLHIVLFCVGASVSRSALQNVGVRPLVLGIALWLCVSVVSWLLIMHIG